MRARSDTRVASLQVQAIYSIGTLARIGNVSADMMRRVLKANGVTFVRVGRALGVPLSEVQRKIPPLWESLCLVEQVRRAQPKRTRLTRLARPVVSGAEKPQG